MRANCCVCGLLTDAHEFFVDGWCCKPCVAKATEVRIQYVIDGKTFTKVLKGGEERTAVMRLVAKGRP